MIAEPFARLSAWRARLMTLLCTLGVLAADLKTSKKRSGKDMRATYFTWALTQATISSIVARTFAVVTAGSMLPTTNLLAGRMLDQWLTTSILGVALATGSGARMTAR